MADFFIDPMREEHIWEIARLEAVCFSSPRPAEALRAELTNDTAFFFTAVCEGTVAGYAGMHCILDEGYIDNIAVFQLAVDRCDTAVLPTGGRGLQARC